MAKIKHKTRKTIAKRFRKTGTGKIRRACANRSHLLGHESRKRKRRLRAGGLVAAANDGHVRSGLPL